MSAAMRAPRLMMSARQNALLRMSGAPNRRIPTMQPDINHWRDISALLDQMLDLPEANREAWMARLPDTDKQHIPRLLEMAALARRVEVEDILGERPEPSSAMLATDEEGDAFDEQAGDEIGPYRLLKPLGRGGMGVVWLAERTDGVLMRQVALKLPNSGVNGRKLAARFARERSILAALNHPNIARLYDAGTALNGQPYLVLEYVEGVTITAFADAAKLSVSARLRLFAQVASAVQYAHGLLVIHRDLKPSNILVTDSGEVRLLDFGIAKLIDEHAFIAPDLTQLTGRALTQQYASPEQVLEQPVGIASDVYSLGVLLFELMTGRLPYALRQTSRAAMEAAIATDEPLRPAALSFNAEVAGARSSTPKTLHAALNGDLDAIVLKALRKAPAQRYSTVAAMVDDIQRHLNHEVVTAQPVSIRYRALKFFARYKLVTALSALAVLSLVVGSGVALWQAREAAAQARLAREEAANATALKDFMVGVLSAGSANQAEANIARQRTTQQLLDAARDRVLADKQMASEARISVLVTLESIYGTLFLFDDSRKLSRVALEAIRARGVKRSDAEFFSQVAQNLMESEPDAALALLSETEALASASNPHDPETQIGLHLARSQVLAQGKGFMNEGLAELDRGIALRKRFPESIELPMPRLLAYRAYMLNSLGRLSEAEQTAAEGARLAREHPSGIKLDGIGLEKMLGAALEKRLSIAAAETAFERARVLGEEVGGESFPQALSARCHRARLLAAASADPRALEMALNAKQIADKARAANDAFIAPEMWRCMAGVQLDLGDVMAARESINQLLLVDTQPFGTGAKLRFKLDARVAAAEGDGDRLSAALAKYAALRAQESPASENEIRILRARAAQLRGDAQTAKTLLAAVRIDATTLAGLEASIDSATLWKSMGEARRAADIVATALVVIERNPERQRLTGLRDKLLKLKG